MTRTPVRSVYTVFELACTVPITHCCGSAPEASLFAGASNDRITSPPKPWVLLAQTTGGFLSSRIGPLVLACSPDMQRPRVPNGPNQPLMTLDSLPIILFFPNSYRVPTDQSQHTPPRPPQECTLLAEAQRTGRAVCALRMHSLRREFGSRSRGAAIGTPLGQRHKYCASPD